MYEHTELIGRDAEAALLELRLQANRRTGGCLVVEGPPGIGKSRLLAHGIERAREAEMAVAPGRARELDRIAPLTTLLGVLRCAEPRAVAVEGLARHEDSRVGVIDRLAEVIENHVRGGPLVVAVDDAHWADELSALALRVLVPRLAGAPVQWLLTRGPGRHRSPGRDAVDSLIAEGVEVIHLRALGDDAVAELCAQMLRARPDADVLDLAARSGGNPLLLTHLISTLWASGQLSVQGGIVTVAAQDLPSTFLAVVERQLRGLSDDARALLYAASVLGRPFTLDHLADLLGRTAVQLLPAANEAMAAGLLVENGIDLVFGHEVVCEAVYNSLSGPVRSVLHNAAAAAALRHSRSPLETVEHLARTGMPADARRTADMRTAAAQITGKAPGTAADLLLRTLSLADEHDPTRPALVAETVRLLSAAGRVAEARHIAEDVLHGELDTVDEAAVRLGLAEALKHCGLNDEVVECAHRGLALDGVRPDVRAQLLAVQAHGMIYSGDVEGATRVATEAVRLGAAAGEQSAVVFGEVARSVAARAAADVDGALVHARAAVDVATREGGAAQHRHPGLWLARALVIADRFTEADVAYTVGQREANRLGTAWSQPLWRHYRAELRMATGRLAEAKAEAEAGLRITERLTTVQLSVPLRALLARIALHRDQLAEAREHIHRVRSLVEEDGVSVAPGDFTFSDALLEEADGRPEAAMAATIDLYCDRRWAFLLLSTEPGAAAALVRIALRVGAAAEASAIAASARVLADRNPRVGSLVGAALHADGLLTGDAARLRSAVERLRPTGRPMGLASALEDLAGAEDSAGRPGAAAAVRQEALQRWQACDATRDAERVRRILQEPASTKPVPVVARVRDGAACVGTWGALTTAELRVIELVTQGLTNRETAQRLYLSPHTVDSHLRHAFTKLGVNSRVELTRMYLAQETGRGVPA